ncbi:alpha/beta fold hydrolase [Glycocaulis sp.]
MAARPSLNEWQDAAQHFDWRGQKIAYWQGGDWADTSKPVLMLIHGFPTASWDWVDMWAPLSAHFRLLAPDMIGFGFSAKPPAYDYSIRDQADLHAGLCAALGIAECHVLAHDYGDTVAQELLARHNASEGGTPKLQSVVFLNGGLFPETHHATFNQKLLHSPIGFLVSRLMTEKRFRKGFSEVFGPNTQPDDAALKEFWALVTANGGMPAIGHKLIRYIAERRENRERWVGALQAAQIPLRVIDGGADPVSGAHMVARYRELVPDPDTVILEGIGHYPQVEAPDAVLAAFLDFHAVPHTL